ncbi:MAG TPA: DUF3006 domain-containing protein [Candidatus Atribacteria bacterium]|nr:DUF3006 domain-containing protein [Candidatus Atribacteria bacterium]
MIIKLMIDRFEGKYAILESQDKNPMIFNFPRHLLPQEAKEGTALNINIDIDHEETKRRKDKIQNLLNKLKEQDKGGDIQL